MLASWSLSIALIVLAAAHIGEETLAGFSHFFNVTWFAGNETCPVGRAKALWIDKIGLFAILALLALGGALHSGLWILIALGIITADVVQHFAFSIGTKGYTPGVATSVLYLGYIIYFFSRPETDGLLSGWLAWLAFAVGLLFIASNYFMARHKVRLGLCQPA
jgi:hypothetical protein